MKFSRSVIRGMAVATIASAAGVVQAACLVEAPGTVSSSMVCYYGLDQYPDIVMPNSTSARSDFLSRLVLGVGSEGFESMSQGDPHLPATTLPLSFPGSTGNITATLSGDGYVENVTGWGAFNTTPGGSNWWETATGKFDISFSKPISAFGFYGTDICDLSGTCLVTLTLTDINNVASTLKIPATGTQDGSLLFYGFVDTLKTYKSIVFGNASPAGDLFGFDDMVIGDLGQLQPPTPPVLPLPGTLALVSLSLLAVALVRRRT